MTAPPDDDVLWARELTYAHDGSPALQGITLGIRTGEIVAVNGARGSGKSTLLSCLSGRLLPDAGEVWFNSVPVHTLGLHSRERLRRERFGWIGNEPQLVPELSAWENAALPLLLGGVSSRTARRAAHEWLERLDVGDCARKRPSALLQAQRQRVAIARSLVHSPTVLFADEPTAPLHRTDRVQALRTLTTAARSHGITVVLATHGPASVPAGGLAGEAACGASSEDSCVDRAITLLDGRCTNGTTAREEEGSATCSLSV